MFVFLVTRKKHTPVFEVAAYEDSHFPPSWDAQSNHGIHDQTQLVFWFGFFSWNFDDTFCISKIDIKLIFWMNLLMTFKIQHGDPKEVDPKHRCLVANMSQEAFSKHCDPQVSYVWTSTPKQASISGWNFLLMFHQVFVPNPHLMNVQLSVVKHSYTFHILVLACEEKRQKHAGVELFLI